MTTRSGLLVVVLAIAAFFAPRLLAGEVIFPHSNAVQVGLEAPVGADDEAPLHEAFGQKFSDESSFYVPELHAHLTAPRTGWIATWTNAVELGRPLTHLSGLSPAYPPTWVLALVTKDAFRLYTWLVVLTVLATGVFAFAFFRALELDVWASVFGALAAALGMPVLYWLTFAMNVSGLCWTFALLWLVTSWVARPSVAKLLGVAACTYALLLSGYPQMTVWEGAFVAAWTIARVVAKRDGVAARARAIAAFAVAVVLGVACAIPVLHDVALALSRSARTDVDADFFLAVLPSVNGWKDVLAWASTLVDPALLGDVRSKDYPVRFEGVAFGAAVVVLALVSWRADRWRVLVPAYAFVVVGIAMMLVPSFYRFGVEHLGLGMSRTVPTWGAIVPMVVCATVAFDAAIVQPMKRPWIFTAIVIAAVVAVAATSDAPAYAHTSCVVGALGALAATQLRNGRVAVLFALGAAWIAGRELVLLRPRDSIATRSALVDALHERLTDGARFAIVGNERRQVLPANEELLLGLASVHSYDSLSPREYQDWTRAVSREGARNRGRRFDRITDASMLDGLADANVAVVLAPRVLTSVHGLEPVGLFGTLFLHRWTGERWAARTLTRGFGVEGSEVSSLSDASIATARIASDEGDRVEVEIDPRPNECVIELARSFHPQWEATGGRAVRVDGFRQGVLVPAGARSVTLEFRPWSRFAWIPMVAFALAFGFAATRALLRGSRGA